MHFKKWLKNEMATKATIYTSSQSKGASVDDTYADEPIIILRLNNIVNYEPASKMDVPKSRKNMQNIIQAIQNKEQLPPIYVRKSPNPNYKYQIVDGHHRYWAYKKLNMQKIPARIIAPENIAFKSKYVQD